MIEQLIHYSLCEPNLFYFVRVNITSFEVDFGDGPALGDGVLVDLDIGDQGVDLVVGQGVSRSHSPLLVLHLQVVEEGLVVHVVSETDVVLEEFVLLEGLIDVLGCDRFHLLVHSEFQSAEFVDELGEPVVVLDDGVSVGLRVVVEGGDFGLEPLDLDTQ